MHDFRLYEDSVISEINRKHKADSVCLMGSDIYISGKYSIQQINMLRKRERNNCG